MSHHASTWPNCTIGMCANKTATLGINYEALDKSEVDREG
jgi:hypothetical protein